MIKKVKNEVVKKIFVMEIFVMLSEAKHLGHIGVRSFTSDPLRLRMTTYA